MTPKSLPRRSSGANVDPCVRTEAGRAAPDHLAVFRRFVACLSRRVLGPEPARDDLGREGAR